MQSPDTPPADISQMGTAILRLDRTGWARAAGMAIAGGALFGLLAYFSIQLSRGDGRVAAVWIPNAVAIAFLLRTRIPLEPLFMVALVAGNIAANLTVGDPGSKALALSLANSLEINIAVYLVRTFAGPRPAMEDTCHLMVLTLLGGIVAPLCSASFAAVALLGGGGDLLTAFLKWWLSDALGIIIITPCALVITDSIGRARWPDRRERIEWVALTVSGTAVTMAVFAQTAYPLLFLVAPLVIVHAFRLGSLGTAVSTIKVAVVASIFTWLGKGPINLVDDSMAAQMIVLQVFIATAFLVGLPVAAVLNGRRQMLEALAAKREEMDLLTNNISDAILRFDSHGICTYVSPSVEDVLGVGPEAFLGNNTTDRMHEDAQKTIREASARLLSGESTKERFTYRRMLDDAEGKAVFIEADCVMAVNPLTQEKEGILFSARDITDRIMLERELVRARRHAENAAQAKSEFLANMSHEIRTPMNGVLGFAELLKNGDLKEKERRHANLIYESGRSMMLLLNDILDISKIEAGQITLSPETVNVEHLVSGCIRLHSAHSEQKGVTLSCHVQPGVPAHIRIDQLRLRQIILNLVGNSVKFTESGRIQVAVRMEDGKLVFAVEDTGIGIPEERLRDIFNPFQQADGGTARKYGGTGLGLTISRQLAELLGGTLGCTSVPGKGSCFVLRVPAESAGDVAVQEGDTAELGNNRALPAPSRILLAEDHDVNRMLVGAMLEKCGQGVDIAVDGKDAVAKVLAADARGEPYDLVLMDIQMPGMDGYAATKSIRDQGVEAHRLPIIAVTANAFPEDIAAARDAGMQGHMAKPLVFAELIKTLHRWLPTQVVADGRVLERPAGGSPSIGNRDIQAEAVEGASVTGTSSIIDGARAKWAVRRSEAVDAVRVAIAKEALDDAEREELARVVHKLAGTAGMFGEDLLGKRASALEQSLKSGAQGTLSRQLAEALLEAA